MPRWLACATPDGPTQALAFTLSRTHPAYTGVLGEAELVHILRHSCGRYGTTLDYLMETAISLQARGLCDGHTRGLVEVAARHGLVPAHAAAAVLGNGAVSGPVRRDSRP